MKVKFQDKVSVTPDMGMVWVTITHQSGTYTDAAMTRKQSKRLRKMLKKAERRA